MSAMTNFAPSLANVSAVARPIPEAPPVTKATLLSTCPGILGLLRVRSVLDRTCAVLRNQHSTTWGTRARAPPLPILHRVSVCMAESVVLPNYADVYSNGENSPYLPLW